MPLATTTNEQATQTLAVGIQRIYERDVESIIWRNDLFLGLPRLRRMPSRGDVAYRWPVHTGGNTGVEAFNEGQPLIAAGSQTYTYAGLAYASGYVRGAVRITGHMVDAARDASDIFGIVEQEMVRVRDDILDNLTGIFLGTGPMGIQLAIDGAGTYAGIARATIAAWGSEENATSGDLIADIELLHRELRDAERVTGPTLWLTSPTQTENYDQRMNNPGMPTFNINTDGSPGTLDYRPIAKRAAYGVPIVEMPDLLNTLWIGMNTNNWRAIEHRPFKVDEISRVDDDQQAQVSLCILAADMNPQKDGKITGLAT